ncbi:MAG: helix-turn-helix domain-containing protein [Spirochaetaceae bacterium]|jgi:transcriptional regulator with XRE-family HTH domain|nr:helix-turn-helix domain-containing protein [Spirochaetaceae bacterium]
MGFRDNLKSELSYKGMQVKELAEKSGVNIHTINNYLNVRGRMPGADAAVKIARALDVSVERLVDGKDAEETAVEPEMRRHLQTMRSLAPADRAMIYALAEMFVDRERREAQRQRVSRGFQLLLHK